MSTHADLVNAEGESVAVPVDLVDRLRSLAESAACLDILERRESADLVDLAESVIADLKGIGL